MPSRLAIKFGLRFEECHRSIIGNCLATGDFKIMTLRKLLLPALVVLLLSSAGLRRAAQGQTGSTGLSGSWVGVVTLPPPLDNGAGGNTLPIMLSFNSNG